MLPRPLGSRVLEPEDMDRPDLSPDAHAHALRGLARINLWSATARYLWRPIEAMARDRALGPVRVLDVACGGGDVAVQLARLARRRNVPVRVSGCDISPRAVASATDRAQAAGAEADFFLCDVLEEPLPHRYDVVTASLFLHHLDDGQATALLKTMAQAARHLVVVDDLRRSRAGYALAFAGTRLLTRSRVVHTDGLRSVAAAFTMEEAASLAEAAGLDGAVVTPHWPFRYLLTWRRD